MEAGKDQNSASTDAATRDVERAPITSHSAVQIQSPPPSLQEQVINFIQAAINQAKAAAPMVPRDIFEENFKRDPEDQIIPVLKRALEVVSEMISAQQAQGTTEGTKNPAAVSEPIQKDEVRVTKPAQILTSRTFNPNHEGLCSCEGLARFLGSRFPWPVRRRHHPAMLLRMERNQQ